MKTKIIFLCILFGTLSFSGCSLADSKHTSSNSNSNSIDSESEVATAAGSTLTERQKKILSEESLPTELDKLSASQERGITNIENAFCILMKSIPALNSIMLHIIRQA